MVLVKHGCRHQPAPRWGPRTRSGGVDDDRGVTSLEALQNRGELVNWPFHSTRCYECRSESFAVNPTSHMSPL